MKKLLAVSVCLLLVFFVLGCTQPPADGQPANTPDQTANTQPPNGSTEDSFTFPHYGIWDITENTGSADFVSGEYTFNTDNTLSFIFTFSGSVNARSGTFQASPTELFITDEFGYYSVMAYEYTDGKLTLTNINNNVLVLENKRAPPK